MTIATGFQPPPGRRHVRNVVALIAVTLLFGLGAAVGTPTTVAAATAPKVAIIVGPNGSATAGNRDRANAAAAEALRYTSNVVTVYSPNATWSRVAAAMSGASIVVYFGRGRGFPSPYSSIRRTSTQDGFGLNPIAGRGNETTKFYGESYVRQIALAPGALVLLHPQAYASGDSETGRTAATLSVARRRVDNYGAGFLAAGAGAVVAETSKTVAVWYIRRVFTQDATLATIWNAAPTRHGHVTGFTSTRTSGAIGRTDPSRRSSRFTRSIVGRMSTTTSTVRRGSAVAVLAPILAPTPSPTVPPTTSGPIVVTANNVTIDGVTITSSSLTGSGIKAFGTSSAPIRNLTIRNCTIRGFNIGIEARHVENLVIQNCVIEDADYAGIAIYSGVGGRISGNAIRRIGSTRTDFTVSYKQNNAYGITLDRSHTGNLTTDPLSSGFVIDSNVVEDVPLWMCMNVHAAANTTFSNNIGRRCPRGIFIAGDGDSPLNHPINITVIGNRLEQSVTKAGGTTNQVGVLTAGLQGGSITGNYISSTFSAAIYDYTGEGNGASVNVTISGNTLTP